MSQALSLQITLFGPIDADLRRDFAYVDGSKMENSIKFAPKVLNSDALWTHVGPHLPYTFDWN